MRSVVIWFFSLFLVVSFLPKGEVHAQFWKDWFQKEKKKSKTTHPKKEPDEAPVVVKKKRKAVEYPASKFKNRYRVDVLVPLHLNDLVADGQPQFGRRLPETALAGLNFYQGIKLAADTLSALGFRIDVYVHDIADSLNTPEVLIRDSILSASDLIIGDVQYPEIKVLAAFAKRNQINFISTVSPSDADVRENIFFTMLQPTLQKHIERIYAAAAQAYSDTSFVVLYRTTNQVDSLAFAFLLEETTHKPRSLPLNRAMSLDRMAGLIDSNRKNVLILPILDYEYVETVLLQLANSFPQYKFEVYGMPSWRLMNSLRRADAYPNIVVYYTSPFYYDLTSPSAQNLVSRYRKQFDGKVSEMVFRGYEVLYWYAFLLQKYGTVFNRNQSDNAETVFTRFEIRLQWNRKGDFLYNENEHLDLYRFSEGSFMIQSL